MFFFEHNGINAHIQFMFNIVNIRHKNEKQKILLNLVCIIL